MIYKKIKDSNFIWNPETTLVFNKSRKVIGRYVDKVILKDSESIKIAKENNIPIDITLQKFDSNLDMDSETESNNSKEEVQKLDFSFTSFSSDSLTSSFYDNHPAFTSDIPITQQQKADSISSDFVDSLTDEFKTKLNCKVNELIYKIIDLESTLKNLSEDYDQLLVENQKLKKQLGK